MKKLYFLLQFAFFGLTALAQNPIPNQSFETWASGAPTNWLVNNAPGVYTTVTQVSPGYLGSSAAKLSVVVAAGIGTQVPTLLSASNGFPITHAYSAFEFYYKADFIGFDACVISVIFYDASNNPIGGGGTVFSTDKTSFTHMSVPLSVGPGAAVKCNIAISVQDTVGPLVGSPGSYIVLDNLSLTGVIGVDEMNDASDMLAYPNPALDKIGMSVTTLPGEKITWKMSDATGRVLLEKAAEGTTGILKDELSVSDLPRGFYLLSLQSEQRRVTRRVLIQ